MPERQKGKPTYSVRWSQYTGKYRATSSSRLSFAVVDTDPFHALESLVATLRLLE